ncbi:MAG: crotonase/enoyl-CoA hydratase family protein [Pseudomonadota bacterium]
MTYETILLDTDSRGVATLTLNLPEKHNALAPQMIADLHEAARALGSDPAVRVVVLTGAGKSFCAGGDLGWMKEQFSATRAERIAEARKLADMLGALNELPKPLIGAINGQAYGGGMGLISVCDIAIAAEKSQFGFTESRLGLIPATISPYVISCLSEGMARRVFHSARLFEAEEACILGLISRAVPSDQLWDAIEAEVAPFLKAAPGAVAASKALARSLGPRIDAETIERTIEALADSWETEEAQEGVSAFFEKRKPSWA